MHANTMVTLDGAASSDPDGGSVTYSWVQTSGNSVTLADAQTAQPSFLAPTNVPTSTALTFRLTVTDGSLSDADDVTVTVTNSAPVANAGPDRTVKRNTTFTLDGRGSSDADGDGLTYTWYRGSQVGTGSILTQALSARGTFTYTLRVQDDHGGWDEDTVAIKVR